MEGGRTRSFAESAMIMCIDIDSLLRSDPYYEPSPDIVQDVFDVLSLGPHFCYIPYLLNKTLRLLKVSAR